MNSVELRAHLKQEIPTLWNEVNDIAQEWTVPVLENLDALPSEHTAFPKTFTDPVLGPIELFEWEVALLDSPLLQRLRGVRQLGMAHAVYTGATHDRLSHTLGVVEVVERMIRALEKNASYHRNFGRDKDPDVPGVDLSDRQSIRLAALLHDIGHGPFSHTSEPLIEQVYAEEFERLRKILRREFPGAGQIEPSEALAVLLVMSDPLDEVFLHPRFRPSISNKEELPVVISARLLGSWRGLRAGYLAGLVSGPIDADKLDYLARDSYFAGLPIGLDVERLISKLEVISIPPDRTSDPYLRKRAESAPNKRLYELGISVAGLTAYEQMIIGRVLLYDRVYYHHKVRCAEAMVRLLFRVAWRERGRNFSMRELLSNISDDGMLYLLSGEMTFGSVSGGKAQAKELAQRIGVRRFYNRAFAFAERFLTGLEGLDKQEQTDTRAIAWQHVMDALGSEDALDTFARDIFERAEKLRQATPEFHDLPALRREDIIVDLTERDPVPASSRGIFMRTESGELTYANLFFNPDKWAEAYKTQKKCGYVFAPRAATKVVALAAQILLFERWNVIMGSQARHLCKLEHVGGVQWADWFGRARSSNLCTPECFVALTEEKPRLLQIHAPDLRVPEEWLSVEPHFKERLADELDVAFGGGFVASVHDAVISGIEHLCNVIETLEKRGEFVKDERPDEKTRLQHEIAKALGARGCQAREASEVGGGETDLVMPGDLVVENKVTGETDNLHALKPDAPWQARRYALAFNRRVFFVVIAYKPANERVFLSLPARVSVHRLEGTPEESVYVRFLIAWGHRTPSKAKAP